MGMRVASIAELEGMTGRRLAQKDGHLVDANTVEAKAPAVSRTGIGIKAEGRATQPRRMNKTEARYRDELLLPAIKAGDIRRFEFEALKIRLGEKLFYTPDFYVVTSTGAIRIDEVKGAHIYEDARIKFKAAAAQFPEFHWRMWQWKEGKWSMILEL